MMPSHCIRVMQDELEQAQQSYQQLKNNHLREVDLLMQTSDDQQSVGFFITLIVLDFLRKSTA